MKRRRFGDPKTYYLIFFFIAACETVSRLFDIAAATAIWCLFFRRFPGPNDGLSSVSFMLSLIVSWLVPD